MNSTRQTIIALDVGEQRIGYALANTVARLPQPGGTIPAGPQAAKQIQELIKEYDASALVIGLPRNLQGEDTAQTAAVRAFAANLKKFIDIPIFLQDEALTSKKAEQELRDRRVRYNKGDVDALAATYILDDYLHSRAKSL